MFKKADGKVAAGNQLSEKTVLAGIRTNRTGAVQELRRGKWVTLQRLSWKKTINYLSSIQTVKTCSMLPGRRCRRR